ncbi:MAG: Hpt domain-containing protein, partial [Fibrobacter sp.]|nr:Hpt domain-containing protein [Fibrobacter sp.]
DLYRKVLSYFLKDDTITNAKDAYANKEYDSLFEQMHNLKGFSGNLGLSALYEAVVPLVETLRKQVDEERLISEQFSNVLTAYERAMSGISLLLADADETGHV